MVGHPLLYSFESVDDVAAALAIFVLKAQGEAFQRHGKDNQPPKFKIAVSGGSLAKTLAQNLVGNNDVKWEQWEIFFADERAVKLDDKDSNYALIKTELLDKLEVQPVVHTIDEAHLDDLTELADDYEQKLIKSFAAKDSVRLPIFDLILLGCGPDGHTASLFPGNELLRETEGWVLGMENSPKPPPRRITLSMPVLCAASRVGFVVTGDGKQDALAKVFDDVESGLAPGRINDVAGEKVVWFTDTSANRNVKYTKKPWRGGEGIPRRGSL